MLKTQSVTFGGKKIVLHELDVAQTMDVVGQTREMEEPSNLDLGNGYEFLPEFVMDEILGQPLKELITPGISHGELEELYKAALDLNPFLARAMTNMASMMRASRMILDGSEKQLSDLLSEGIVGSGSTDSVPS